MIVEGGASTLWEFFAARSVDSVAVFIAPRISRRCGRARGVGGQGFRLPEALG